MSMIVSGGIRIFFKLEGERGPFLFLHHGLFGSHRDWYEWGFVKGLAREFRLVIPDARGHGRSDKPHEPEAYGRRMADDVVAVLDDLSIEKAHVSGYSMGGGTTLGVGRGAPERVHSLIVGGAGPRTGAPPEGALGPVLLQALPAGGAAALPRAVMDQACERATRAGELDNDLPEVEVARGLVDVFRHRDYVRAERRFDRAIELNPSYEFAHRARALLMVHLGRFDEGRAAIDRALDLDPLNPFVASLAGDVYAGSGDTERALELYYEASALDVGHPLGYQGAAVILCQRGDVAEAEALFEQARALSENDPLVVGDLGYCFASSGRSDEARVLLAELRERASSIWVSPVSVGLIHLALGERDEALAAL